MTIVMGLDQHRAQITAEWLDTATGEVSRGRIMPADRSGVRKFLARFAGLELEVALEATTGWRFVVEELRRVGASVHLAEPAETSALRGNKQRAKNDRADARHLRELLMAGRLPECWIAPDHLLDLRARVRLRHTLVDERGEWQQRMQAVLYHHGLPKRAGLLTGENRAWIEQQPLPGAGREQITVALGMIDALEVRITPLDKELRAYARRQTGCRALQSAHYGIGALTSVVILAELGDTRRFSSSREAVRYGGMDITVHASDKRRAPGTSPAKARQRCAGRYTRPRRPRGARRAPTTPITSRPPSGSAVTAPASRSRASCSNAATTHSENSETRRSRPREDLPVRATPERQRCTAAGSRHAAAATFAWTASKDRAAATLHPAGSTIAVGTPVARRPPHRSQRAL
jgi:transposase